MIKHSTNIFGKKIKNVTGPGGKQIKTVSKSRYIFGNEVVEIYDGKRTVIHQDGRELLAVGSDENPELMNLIIKLMQETRH